MFAKMKPSRIQKQRSSFQFLILILVFFSMVGNANGQHQFIKNDYDTTYICSYTEEFTARVLSALSFVDISFKDNEINKSLKYGINSKVAIGLGFNYSVFGINLGISPWASSVSNSKYGKTKSIDFRMNLYGRKIIFDLYLMSHTGFYLSNPESVLNNWEDNGTYPLRPDMTMFSAGIVSQYIFNNKKFSLRATYLQNEWQKKSAGSFIIGGSFFYSHFHGDSSFIPTDINPPYFINGYKFNHSSSINFGINGGYSHTFVLKRNYFFSIGLSLGPQIGYSETSSSDIGWPDKSSVTMGLNGLIRTGIGYNSRRIYFGAFFINEYLSHQLSINNVSSSMSVGIFRLNFAYRFTLKKPIKFLNPNYWKFLQSKESKR